MFLFFVPWDITTVKQSEIRILLLIFSFPACSFHYEHYLSSLTLKLAQPLQLSVSASSQLIEEDMSGFEL